MKRESFEEVEDRYGHKWWMLHRADLHDELRRLAQDPQTFRSPPAIISLASDVTAIDAETGTITLKDGSQAQKDVVVVADGFRVNIDSQTQVPAATAAPCFADTLNPSLASSRL